ncbi:MAG: hypothetical protein ACLFVS_04095 [Candidatus Acetothermia bacterium]
MIPNVNPHRTQASVSSQPSVLNRTKTVAVLTIGETVRKVMVMRNGTPHRQNPETE